MAALIDADTRRKANLRVLQRMDRNVIDIAITATHVVLYGYDNTKQSSWEKKNVEGTLFVTKRSDAPRFKLVVLNRSSTENLNVPITASFQMQVKDPYLIFRDGPASTDFTGIWFHDGKERDQIASYLEQVLISLVNIEEMERSPPPPQSLVSDEVDDTARRDAGAALLSTLTLGSSDNAPPAAYRVATGQELKPSAVADRASTMEPTARGSLSTHQNLVLDKKSLQLSLLSLIQDERFLDLIHAQYLKVVHRRADRQQQEKSSRR
ncbi:hypothetical protein ACHAXA_003701 [Cyclostephanos tholiformis]|uniref:Uncharacterized protein n=1 Tax=Cyclostephanos tholiformis TaxID=382380 RepID=A0ABD3RZD0_9STRA